MAELGTTAKLPLDVTTARGKLIEALQKKYSKAYYLKQLEQAVDCSFIQVLPSKSAVASKANTLGYVGVGTTAHFTETWTKLIQKKIPSAFLKGSLAKASSQKTCTLDEALAQNRKSIYLDGSNITLRAVAHELVHWLNHPNWGKTFDPVSWISEGAAEGLMRYLLEDDCKNSVYDSDVTKLQSMSSTDDLLPAYFDGDVTSLKKLATSFGDKDASNRAAELT